MVESSSKKTYNILTNNLGKEFVDQSLLNILWFDNTFSIAESHNTVVWHWENVSHSVPQEITNILSDRVSAITFARERVMNLVHNQERYYYGETDKDRSWESLEDVKILISDMINDMTSYTNDKTILDGFIDLVIVFRMDFEIKQLYPHLFGTSVDIVWDYTPTVFTNMLWEIKYPEQLLTFLESFLSKIKNSSQQDQSSLYVMSEFLLAQSWEKDGIWNFMNPMCQRYTLDGIWGRYYSKNIKWFFPKLFFRTKQYIPHTKENIRSKMQKILDELNTQYCFPQKYSTKS